MRKRSKLLLATFAVALLSSFATAQVRPDTAEAFQSNPTIYNLNVGGLNVSYCAIIYVYALMWPTAYPQPSTLAVLPGNDAAWLFPAGSVPIAFWGYWLAGGTIHEQDPTCGTSYTNWNAMVTAVNGT
jgi:hypothetical protein